MRNYCVYMHKNKVNGKVYIGMTMDTERRWRNQGIEYKPKRYNTRPFWNAICKYGWNNFEHIILKDKLTKQEAMDEEKRLIAFFNARNSEFGYNVALGGDGGIIYKEHPRGMLGKKHPQSKKDQQRELMKRLVKEGKCGATWKNGHPRGMLGKTHSEEYKRRVSEMMSGANNPHAKTVIATLPDGSISVYYTKKSAMKGLGISNHIFDDLIKTGLPYVIKKNNTHKDRLRPLEGLKLRFADDTEITNISKDILAS